MVNHPPHKFVKRDGRFPPGNLAKLRRITDERINLGRTIKFRIPDDEYLIRYGITGRTPKIPYKFGSYVPKSLFDKFID